MKKLAVAVLAVVLMWPGVVFAGSATNAALGLGAFAVFNQFLGGVGVFGGFAPAPPVYAAPVYPAPVFAAPAPVFGPAPVIVAPAPVFAAPAPVVVAPAPIFVAAAPRVVVARPVVVAPRIVRPFHPVPVYHSRPVLGHPHW